MNSRVEAVLNRLELIARKMEMSIEDAIAVLEGKHPTHVVVQKYKPVEEPSAPNAPSISGNAAASDEQPVPQAAASTASDGETETAEQNHAAAESEEPPHEAPAEDPLHEE